MGTPCWIQPQLREDIKLVHRDTVDFVLDVNFWDGSSQNVVREVGPWLLDNIEVIADCHLSHLLI
jgi:hypothetical protein